MRSLVLFVNNDGAKTIVMRDIRLKSRKDFDEFLDEVVTFVEAAWPYDGDDDDGSGYADERTAS